jgi:hypothetical protein
MLGKYRTITDKLKHHCGAIKKPTISKVPINHNIQRWHDFSLGNIKKIYKIFS